MTSLSRRTLVTNAALIGVVGAAAACGTDAAESDATAPLAQTPPRDANVGGNNSDESAVEAPQIAKADIPVGGGLILAEQQLVLTQPEAGVFKAFSAVCTHKQCLVTKIEDAHIKCTCHGSSFSVTDGSVLGGPAPRSLPEIPVTERKKTLELPA